ncbi:hypothetical protein SPFL3102_00457 [Sporomusaceae bacterium FL31]|nr:hypothetical protein SPFL3101_01615 [Sporomusaceae bacterium FL31]GCE32661.1 hypothetical protein SPFL3102_00457 [Sporomusaceae bacterium]
MDNEYYATYTLDKVVIHIVSPPQKSKDEVKKCLYQYHSAFLCWWNTLSMEECLKINKSPELNQADKY